MTPTQPRTKAGKPVYVYVLDRYEGSSIQQPSYYDSGMVVLDLTPNGDLIGVEVLDASRVTIDGQDAAIEEEAGGRTASGSSPTVSEYREALADVTQIARPIVEGWFGNGFDPSDFTDLLGALDRARSLLQADQPSGEEPE